MSLPFHLDDPLSTGDLSTHVDRLTQPERVWSRSEILTHPCPVPTAPGVYAWWFRSIPPEVPTDGCLRFNDLTLLYVGISPSAPPTNGKPPSSENLRKRIKYHLTGNAYGSTLRLTLGCLLQAEIGTVLRRVGTEGKRLTFADREPVLSEWMGQNAYVCWTVYDRPWELEHLLFRRLTLPLNLDDNPDNAFHKHLSTLRRTAKQRAREMPAIPKE